MSHSFRIVVADDERDMRENLKETLQELGHEVVAVAETGRELIDFCKQHQPDLAITDIKMPEMDGIEAAIEIYATVPVPIILISAYHESELIERAESDHIMAYLVKPIKSADLETAISIAVRRFEQFQTLRQETNDLKQALVDRKIIERAKGILMRRADLDENDAFRRLQKLASDKNKKLIRIAEMIVTAEEALDD